MNTSTRNSNSVGAGTVNPEGDTSVARLSTIVDDNVLKFLNDFPEVRTEGGQIDFERLKAVLGGAVDTSKERYGLSWPGRADCFKAIQTPSVGTLLPRADRSVAFDESTNVMVEGDNLEVLKLLQKAYASSIKMIYIDPPYNTGNDFIYPDDYSESLQTYLEFTGQVDSAGKVFSTNTETNGRFHSKWLSMMYPRLYLARNLLKEDGVLFVGVDDHEVHNLRRICDEIFGEENFVCTFIWEKRYSPPPDTKDVGYVHDNILLYRRSSSYRMGLLPLTADQQARYKNPDNDSRGPWKPMDYTCRYTKAERPNLYYKISNPNTRKAVLPKKTRVWAFSSEVHKQNEKEQRIWWGKHGKAGVPALKNFLSDIRQGMMPMTLLKHEAVGNTDEATKELRQVIPDFKYTPKPIRLIKHLMAIANVGDEDTVLDFFAGSGTTGVAVLESNAAEGTHRRFILVQLPESTGHPELPLMTDVIEERLKRIVAKLPARPKHESDVGFRVFALSESNFLPWNGAAANNADELGRQLDLHVGHIRADRRPEQILYELLLKSGFPLTTLCEKKNLAGKTLFSVADGALIICLEPKLTLELIRAIADLRPERVVCLDEGFAGNDQLKTNAVQSFRTKGVTSFKTV